MRSININSAEYPVLLKKLPDAPENIYVKGNFELLSHRHLVSVVGSRMVTGYGEWVINRFVSELVQYGVVIVSGFMYGVDGLSHEAALRFGGTTVAVLPGGVDNIVPVCHEDLYRKISDRGLLISEYPENVPARKYTFIKRNRIVAGLSSALLVVEAGEKSGSLITAAMAKAYKRKVFAVPGNLNSKNSTGTLKLIKEKNADLCLSPRDVLEYLNITETTSLSAVNMRYKSREVSSKEHTILTDLISLEPLNADELSLKTGWSVAVVLSHITDLILLGSVEQRQGKYVLCS